MRKFFSGEGLALSVICLVAAAFFIMPLALLGRVGLMAGNEISLAPLLGAIQDHTVLRALWNSLASAGASAILSLMLGTLVALAVGLTDIRFKRALTFLILIPMMIPPHVTAIAWIQALGPASPILRAFDLAPEIGSTHPLYSASGVVFLLGLQHMPLVFLVVLAALRSLPQEMSDAARTLGARPWRLLRRIILPLLQPTLIAGFGLAFISALGNFGIPALLGIPARFITLPVLIWRKLSSFGPLVLHDIAVIATLLAVIAIVAIVLQMMLIQRSRNALIGTPQPPLALSLGRARPLVEIVFAALIVLTLFLPISALFGTALVTTYGLPLNSQTVTVANFSEILFNQSVTLRAFANSTLIAGAAAIATALLAIFIARLTSLPRRAFRQAGWSMTTLAEISYAIPGLVISVAFILAFLKPLPIVNVSLYGTGWIVFAAYLCAFLAIALKPVTAATSQLDQALDDAARVSGAGFWMRMRKILLPLIAPAAASGAILVFLTAYNEVTVSALLWSTGNETIGTTIFNYEDGGYTTLAAAMSAVTVVATIALMALLDRLGRHAPAGVVPWRI